MKYDLHIHSNITDGKHSRDEIINLAKCKGLEYIAFTEHNNYVEAADEGITIIKGIEFDVKFEQSFHLLCYFPKFTEDINNLLVKYKSCTSESTKKLVESIKSKFDLSDNFNFENISSKNGYKTKRDVISWLIQNGYADSPDEASKKYTGKKAISYVPKFSLSFEEVVECIHRSNGFTFLAHPESLKLSDNELDTFLCKLKEKGLDGIEVLNSSKNDQKKESYYMLLANRYELMTSSGSDFHDISEHNLGVDNDYSIDLIQNLLNDKKKKL